MSSYLLKLCRGAVCTLLLIVGVGLLGSTYAQSTIGFKARFCEFGEEGPASAKETKFAVSPGEEKEMCIDLLNNADEPMNIHVNFVDATLSANGGIACLQENKGDNFGDYVTNYDETYEVPADGFVRINPKLQLPATTAGTIYGCITTYNADAFNPDEPGINTLARNGNYIEVYVDNNIEVGLNTVFPENYNQSDSLAGNKPVYVGKGPDGGYEVAVGLDNVGGLDQETKVSGKITDILGNQIVLPEKTKTVSAGGEGFVVYNVGQMPWYKGPFDISLTVKHKALSEFETEFITKEMLAEKTQQLTAGFFLFPWWLIVVLLVILLIVRLIKKMKQRAAKKRQELEELKQYKQTHPDDQQQQQ